MISWGEKIRFGQAAKMMSESENREIPVKVFFNIGFSALVWTGKNPVWVSTKFLTLTRHNDVELPIKFSKFISLQEEAQDYLEKSPFPLDENGYRDMSRRLVGHWLTDILNNINI